MNEGKKMMRRYLPPLLVDLISRTKREYGFFGHYPCWEAARRASSGYDANHILEKVCAALLQVKQGVAAYERDSVLFDKVKYSWPLLTALLWIASRHENRLNLMDVGGSLGSSYYQCRSFIGHLHEVQWSIVEQESFVSRGREFFEDEVLKFYHSVEECISDRRPDAVLLSSVLPYLESPYCALKDILSYKPSYLVIDRTPFIEGRKDRLTVQIVPQEIYGGSYPAWMLSQESFLELMLEEYRMVAEFEALAGEIDLGDDIAHDKGFIFARHAI